MGTVVLMGYSTSGKSTILRNLKSKLKDRLEVVDTDEEIAGEDEHIYNVYLRRTEGSNRQGALVHIKEQEEQILNSLDPQDAPRLIAAGPALPSRTEAWDSFVARVKPVCFYLEITAQEVREGLCWRRCKHLELVEIRDDPSFGCWDEGTTTEYKDGRWVVVNREKAIANIEREMSPLVKIYERYCNGGKFSVSAIRSCKEVRERLYKQIVDFCVGS